jgi:phage terminase small subunit
MGRGRAKAKQQKVARELKYSTHNTDLTALQRELGGYPSAQTDTADAVEADEEGDYDEYDDWAEGRP